MSIVDLEAGIPYGDLMLGREHIRVRLLRQMVLALPVVIVLGALLAVYFIRK